MPDYGPALAWKYFTLIDSGWNKKKQKQSKKYLWDHFVNKGRIEGEKTQNFSNMPSEFCHKIIVCLVEVMEFQLSYFKSWKMMLWKCCTQYASKYGKLSSVHRTGKGQFSFQSQRKAMPKNAQTTAQLHSSHMLVK